MKEGKERVRERGQRKALTHISVSITTAMWLPQPEVVLSLKVNTAMKVPVHV